MQVGLIWAQTPDGVIGSNNTIPWHVAEDFAHFKRTTKDGVVIMGHKTWQSLPAKFRPLPDRVNVVLSRQAALQLAGAVVCGNLTGALNVGQNQQRAVWIIGGEQVYRQALPLADKIVVTIINVKVAGDAFAPALTKEQWRLVTPDQQQGWQLSRSGVEYKILTYIRNN